MKLVRVIFRCTECGYRCPVSGPVTTDWEKCKPVCCGKCRGQREFVREEKAA